MRVNIFAFIESQNDKIIRAFVNIFFFLPYFFCVKQLLLSLFSPWKNIQTKEKSTGSSISESFSRFTDNLISRFIGFYIRFFTLVFFLFVQILYLLCIPIFYLLFVLTIPLRYLLYLSHKPDDVKKKIFIQNFIKNHLVYDENRKDVEKWAHSYWLSHQTSPWWSKDILFSIVPFAKDWTSGYTPTLNQYSEELTRSFSHYKNLIGRNKELELIQKALLKSNDANVLLVGEEGVGKTVIVESFSKSLSEGKGHPLLLYKRVLKLSLEKLLSEAKDYISRENILADIFCEAQDAGNIIIYIESLDRYIKSEEDKINLSNVIAKYARSNRLHFIATITPSSYQRYVVSNEIISSVFNIIEVQEISSDQAFCILQDNIDLFENRYKLTIPFETIKQAIILSDKYLTEIPFPEKSFELLDEACIYTLNQLKQNIVPVEAIQKLIEEKTHVPISPTKEFKSILIHLEEKLDEFIVDQYDAKKKIASILRKAFTIPTTAKKPLASFLLLGPTGVGKTETAKALASILFKDHNRFSRFDMSQYQSINDIAQLIGSFESQEPGLLTKAIRSMKYGILLLDEIEKANHDLLNIFLSILDEGYFNDIMGKRINCTNLIIIATSNAASDYLFSANDKKQDNLNQSLLDHLINKHIFNPEFINRFDGIVIYQPLDENSVNKIAQKIILSIKDELYKKNKITIIISPQLLQTVIKKSYDPRFGARNMKRIIQEEIEDKIAKYLLEHENTKNTTLTI